LVANIRVRFLGAGDAFSAGGRHQAGYLVETGETSFLLDCGATALASLKREGLSPGAIDTIFLSHLHGDHFAGIPFLFLDYTYSEQRTHPLRIAGPPGTEERVSSLFQAMYSELSRRSLPFELEFIEMLPQRRLEIGAVAVDPFRVPHQEKEISLGLGIQADGRSILYSGDTGWTEDLVSHSEGTQLFICECCFFETRVSFHLDYPRLWENHQRFGTDRLILTHVGREVLAHKDEVQLEVAADGLAIEI
jgi:ribonuclease BN (tRNA processing enzyme)